MKRIDRWLLTALLRRNPNLTEHADVPEVLGAARVTAGMTRAQVADALAIPVVEVLAFDLGLTDPRLSRIRRYTHAVGAMVHTDVTYPTTEEPKP